MYKNILCIPKLSHPKCGLTVLPTAKLILAHEGQHALG